MTARSFAVRGALAALSLCAVQDLVPGAGHARACAPMAAQDAEGYDAVLERCEVLERRNPMRYHFQGWQELAATGDPRAIAELAARYKKPKTPKEQARYLIALAAASAQGEATLAAFDAWREAATAPEDAWLWFQALGARAKAGSYDVIVEVARTHKSIYMRAAAVEALASAKAEVLYTLVPELCAQLPKKSGERGLMVGALATAMLDLANKKTRTSSEFQRMALSVVSLLDDEEIPRSSKFALARHFQKALDSEMVSLDANYWRRELNAKAQEAKAKKSKDKGIKYVKPSFFGVEANGERIAYVIDMSDSMCEPVEVPEKAKHGPLSGPKKEGDAGPKIPWQVIKNRFDLAREQLKLSLRQLGEDQYFTVITFGDKGELLDGLDGLVKATRGNVNKVIKELDSIELGSPKMDKIHGTLKGQTNLHAGIRLAFRVRERGAVEEFEHVDLSGFEDGIDTLFLLSDGNPSFDDYETKDADYGDGRVVSDRESGKEADRTKELLYPGPYAAWDRLLEDVQRMNMFREVEIHCISIGDANDGWLKRLADYGLGSVANPLK
ncbi:MAG: hypothetical protein R3F49_16930 [Planctomycetota bacterium]